MTPRRLLGVAPGPPLDPDTWSGTSRRLFEALDRRGFRVHAVDGSNGRISDLAAKATTVHRDRRTWRQRYELSALGRAAASRNARRHAEAAGAAPDVLLQIGAWHDLGRYGRARLRCSYHDGNIAVHARSGDLTLGPSARIVARRTRDERRIYDRLDLIFPMSDWLRRSFLDDFAQPPEKVVTVGAGPNLDVPETPPRRDTGRPVLLFVGKDFPRKGGPEVIAAFRTVRERHPSAELVVVGPPRPPEGAGDVEGLRYVGPVAADAPEGRARLDALFAEATAFVMPSRYEPFGIVFLEAMAWGLPCVAADACAMPEIVEDGVTGFVVPPQSPDVLADRLARLAADPERGLRMGAAGLGRQRERFNWDAVADRIRDAACDRLTDR
ncbi:MAG TPA: glycosyltransferase family 4 protein [Solirubrobacteraceae bacterium]|nr:glycosyltransferase family 4 protein [Solirubrobacteraceae bacterium]